MGSIGETVSGWWGKLTGKTPQQTVAPIAKTLPDSSTIGAEPEPTGYTSAGGRRHKKRGGKTRKMKKGGKRTRKH
jgi:hypothetical protein